MGLKAAVLELADIMEADAAEMEDGKPLLSSVARKLVRSYAVALRMAAKSAPDEFDPSKLVEANAKAAKVEARRREEEKGEAAVALQRQEHGVRMVELVEGEESVLVEISASMPVGAKTFGPGNRVMELGADGRLRFVLPK